VAADDLSAPLGQNKAKKQRFVLPIAVPHVIAGALGLFVAIFVGWALLANDPLGGEPVVVVAAKSDGAAKKSEGPGNLSAQGPDRYDGPGLVPGPVAGQPPSSNPTSPPQSKPTPTPGMQTITIIDGTSGRRQDVEIPLPQDSRPRVPVDRRLLDTSRHGSIPKIGADGVKPAEAYASASSLAPGSAEKPRIAIVIGGLGISATNTNEALAKLPGAVTLAFSPYAADAERLVARARVGGHEVLLQVPMEPFDYPDNDPGPQTLLTTLLAEQNLDRLYWLMSRFQGYVGVVSVMGNRFTASERALTPVLNEVTRRGLIYLDDGGSQRSLAGQIAGAYSLPFAKAEVVLDAVPTPTSIDRALTRLEALARERGIAVGIASATPAAVERIAQWAKAAEDRGLVLVPITVAAIKPKAS
jgi:polysaccharide deacetylase 2 family uncharacterized protein YibQ